MALKYGKKNQKQHYILYTVILAFLLMSIFLGMVGYLYEKTENDAYENLHIQTKQIKDDIILQLTSDRENLITMANFAAKLYNDGDDYSLLFESFRAIGMIENIGILNPDNTLATKSGVSDVSGMLSFDEEVKKSTYISGRTGDVTKENYELIRSAVPIISNGKTVGILYGVIKPEKFGQRYKNMVTELDAQLFVYEKETGDILIDTVHEELGNISFLKDREYTKGTSYEQLVSNDKGFVSFRSAYRNENLHMHYSTIEEFDWIIALGRYDSQVFAETHKITHGLLLVFLAMLVLMSSYILLLMINERRNNAVVECASDVRKELLETTNGQNNIQDALMEVCRFAKARSALFFDTNGEVYHYISPQYEEVKLSDEGRKFFKAELLGYASEFHKLNGNTVNLLCVKPDKHLVKTNLEFYEFLKKNEIKEVSFSSTISQDNRITILATLNSKRGKLVRKLAQKVSACFSMALYNKNHLTKTTLAATTDALTEVRNRVAYKNDLLIFDEEKPKDFSCIYIDVNELHICNNLYGHAAGDEMLLYIANTLKEVFYGHNIYRMGGDEFLVFCKGVRQDTLQKNVELFIERLKPRNYHVAVGMSYRSQDTNTEDMVKEAEVRMYEEKARYYQNKEQHNITETDKEYVQVKTGILEIDTMLSVMKEKYNGIYRVSLKNDKARRILMPAYLKYNENEEHFSDLFSKYVAETVDPDYHRAVTSFLNYDAIRQQLSDGDVPKIRYKKTGGETVVLSVYKLGDSEKSFDDTLWVFAKE